VGNQRLRLVLHLAPAGAEVLQLGAFDVGEALERVDVLRT